MDKRIIEKKLDNNLMLINYSNQSVCVIDKNGQEVWERLKRVGFNFDLLKQEVVVPKKERAKLEEFLVQLAQFLETSSPMSSGMSLQNFFLEQDVPLVVGLEINQKCQMKCRHCYNAHNSPKSDLPLELIKELAEDLARIGTPFVIITGGEPLLHPQFEQIVEVLTANNLAVKIFSNGYHLDEIVAKFLAAHKIFLVGFTLFGSVATDHEYISRVSGSFKRIIRAIRLVKDAGINTDVTFFLMKHNFSRRQKMFAWARKELGLEANFSFSLTPCESGSLNPLSLEISSAEQEVLFREQNIHYDPLIYGGDKSVPCMAGKTLCAVKCNGFVTPCVSLDHPVGNLRLEKFSDIWYNSDKLKIFKKLGLRDLAQCNQCNKNQFCLRCYVSASVLSNLFGSDPHACQIAETIKRISKK